MAVTTIFSETKLENFYLDTSFGLYRCDFNAVLDLSLGDECQVVWDGLEFSCTVVDLSHILPGTLGFGNLSILQMDSKDEPFAVGFDSIGISFFSTIDTSPMPHTVTIYKGSSNGIVLVNPLGKNITYGEYKKIRLTRANGEKTIYSEGESEETTINLDFAKGDMIVTPDDGKFFSKVGISKPENLLPENIIKDVNVAGIVGTKTIKGEVETTVDLDFSEGNMEITPNEGTLFSKVQISKPTNLIAKNIAKDVEVAGIVGTHEGSGEGSSSDNGTEVNLDTVLMKTVTKVTASEATSAIPAGLFSGCVNLETASMPLCTSIGSYTFYNCSSLQDAEFSQCTYIGDSAFQNCSSLSNAIFPKCTTVGNFAFQGCSTLSDIDFTLCTTLSSCAFKGCTNITEAIFPSCTKVGSSAFHNCSALTKASFPKATSIYINAFSGCSQMSEIYAPLVTGFIGAAAFMGCSSLLSAEFSKCTGLNNSAFNQCINLSYVSLPQCTSIYQVAFFGCSNLTTVYIPKVKQISNRAFMNCYMLQSVDCPTCTSIDYSVFTNCSSLSYASFPSATTIGSSAFMNCSNLATVYFPSVTTITSSVFANCTNLTTANFSRVTSIYSGAFHNAFNSEHCDVCFNALTYAYDGFLFAKWSSIGSTVFPKLATMYSRTFFNSPNLKYAYLPAAINIYSSVFAYCYELETVSLPVCVNLGYSAFQNCQKLMSLYLLGTSVPKLYSTNTLAGTPLSTSTLTGTFGSVFVRESLLESFKTSTVWSYFASRIVGLTDEEIAALE